MAARFAACAISSANGMFMYYPAFGGGHLFAAWRQIHCASASALVLRPRVFLSVAND
jgi:hypothetical protein